MRMRKIVAWVAVLLSVVAASCSANDSSKGADAGAGGEAAGQPSAIGGDEPGSAGSPTSGGSVASGGDSGGPASGGEGAGQGGEAGGSPGTFSIEGTVHAPEGGDVEATIVIGCAWIDGGCDEQWSQAVQVSKSGASSPYVLEGLKDDLSYFVLFWKDVNESGEVDDDDYIGVVADEGGAARAFTSAAVGADGIMAVQQEIAATDVPAELVGDWFLVATSIGVTNAWTFGADGSASNTFTLNSSVCGGGAGTATSSHGAISVEGDQLSFQPTSGQKTVKPCSGPATTSDYYTSPRHFSWRVAPSTTQAGTALYLTNLQDPNQTEAEFQKL